MAWVEQRDGDLHVATGSFWEFTYDGGLLGSGNPAKLSASGENLSSFLAGQIKQAVDRKGKASAHAFGYDDYREKYVVNVKALQACTLRQLRQPETVNVVIPADVGGPATAMFTLERTRMNVGQSRSDPLDPISATAAVLANAQGKVVNTAKRARDAVTETVSEAAGAVQGLLKAAPVIGVALGIVAVFLLVKRA